MKFYTNVQLIGNQFLVRGVENGRRYEHRDEFFPTLFVKSKKKTKYKTLNGEAVEAIHPGSVRDCREFYKRYDDVEGFEIYGNDRYIYQYISEKYPEDEVKFDISQIKLVTLDISLKYIDRYTCRSHRSQSFQYLGTFYKTHGSLVQCLDELLRLLLRSGFYILYSSWT